MEHIKVLARKYRPKKFSDLIGQNIIVQTLKNIIANNSIHHAYLLTGNRGIGKTTIARIIAKALNCSDLQNNEPCTKCQNCKEIDNGVHVDVIEIDAASNTGVENIRELIENCKFVPSNGKYKIYIIDEVHMLSKSAFNAMLKTLEEPPLHAIFILATTDLQKVPVTILSRCLQFKLKNLTINEISKHLNTILNNENIKFESPALLKIANYADGSMRDALSILEQIIAFSNDNVTEVATNEVLGAIDDDIIIELLINIGNYDIKKVTANIDFIVNNNYNLESILISMNKFLAKASLLQIANNANSDIKIKQLSQIVSINNIHLFFEIINLGIEQLSKQQNNNQQAIFTMIILRMLAFKIGKEDEQKDFFNNKESPQKLEIKVSDKSLDQTIEQMQKQQQQIKIKEDAISENKKRNISIMKQDKNINKLEAKFSATILDADIKQL